MNTNPPNYDNPSVSIVVPVYNVEPYLRECLDSVLAQTFAGWECICVDDGSMDGSPAILAEYAAKDQRFRIVHQPNGGLSSARNAGMDAANGKYLYFLDSDDTLAVGTLERLLTLSETQDLDQILFGTELVAEPGSTTAVRIADLRQYYEVPATIANRILSGPALFSAMIGANAFFVSVPLRFFRRGSIPDGLRFPVGLVHEDNYFSPLALLAARRAVAIQDRLYRRRIRAGSITTTAGNAGRHATDLLTIYRLLGDERKNGRIPGTARSAFAEFRRELYRVHISRSTRKRNVFARAADLYRAFGFRPLLRRLLHRLWGR